MKVPRRSRGRLRPPVGWATVAGVGSIAGIGFAVSILIATLAFTGTQLQEAKLGVPSTVLAAPALAWLVFRTAGLLRPGCRSAPCSAQRRSSPTSAPPSTPPATASAAPPARRSPSWSTATSSGLLRPGRARPP